MRVHTSFFLAACAAGTLAASACSNGQGPTTPSTPVPEAMPASPAPAPETAPATAGYRVTFQGTWSASSHPADFPSSPHFSPLVGAVHNGSVRFWSEGSAASAGIKEMSERGQTSPLDQEVAMAVAAGTAERALLGGGINSPGVTSLEFQASQMYPLVTLVTMIAPSPDWFVGVSALPLFENGRWADEVRVELVPWDAGTDSGSTFNSPDIVTRPPLPISRIAAAPLSPGGRVTPLGTFTFTRLP